MFKNYSPCFKAAAAALLITVTGLSLYYGEYVTVSEQWPLFDALRNTASIIFAVIGAWFAIVYPDRIKFTKSTRHASSPQAEANLDRFFHPLISSTLVILCILIVGVFLPLLKQIPFLLQYKEVGRTVLYLLLSLLTLWQMLSVLAIIELADRVKGFSDEQDAKVRINKKLNESGYTVTQEEAKHIQTIEPGDST